MRVDSKANKVNGGMKTMNIIHHKVIIQNNTIGTPLPASLVEMRAGTMAEMRADSKADEMMST